MFFYIKIRFEVTFFRLCTKIKSKEIAISFYFNNFRVIIIFKIFVLFLLTTEKLLQIDQQQQQKNARSLPCKAFVII